MIAVRVRYAKQKTPQAEAQGAVREEKECQQKGVKL
jgi:hypothetical protein